MTNNNMQNQNQGRGSNLSDDTRSKGGQNSPGNFKKDSERASEAGKKGGQISGGNRSGSSSEE